MSATFNKTKDAGGNAPAPISFTAAGIARDLFKEHLSNVHAPKDHRVVPEITVSITYRFESTKE